MPRGPRTSVKSFGWLLYPEATTGFSKAELEAIFQKYCGPGTAIPGRRALYDLLNYAKTYPTARAKAQKYDSADKGFGWNMTLIHRRFKYLARKVNDLQEVVDKRFDDDNKIPVLFDYTVTNSLDTFPWRVQRRKGYMRQRVLYQGKYKCHVLKFQGVLDNIGNFLFHQVALILVQLQMAPFGKIIDPHGCLTSKKRSETRLTTAGSWKSNFT